MKQLPAPSSDLRDYLPAIEPERQVSDWGRSERVEGVLDKTIYEFLYHYWFRCEVEGIEHVPADGGALLVSNHSGALPPDATMILKAVKEEHARPRPVHLTVEHFFKGNPLFSMLVPKIGGVPAHPANVQRLLYDEGQLVLVFPEGRKGTEKLYKDRYRLRRFGRGGFVEAAMRAQVPIVPIALVGAEESMPVFAQLGALQRLTGLLYFPITPTFPHFGLLGFLGYLPAKFKIRFLEPIPTDQWGAGAVARPRARPERGRRHPRPHPGGAPRHARQAHLGVVRMRVLVTGISSFWGGRLAQALERDPAVEVIVGVSPEDPTCELERTEYVRVGTQHALLRRIVQAAQIDTVVDSRLIVDSTTASARAAHEANVIGTMNILAACSGPDSPVRKFVFKSTAHYYGCEQDDPAYFTERMQRPHPPRTRLERDIVEAEKAVTSFAERNRGVTVTTLRFVNGLGPDLRTAHASLFSLPVLPSILGFDPRYQFIHEDDIVGVLEHAVREDLPGIYNAAGDGVLVLSEVASLLGKPLAPLLPPWGTGLALEPLKLLGLQRAARDASASCASAAGSTTASSRRPACRCATRRARPCRRSPSTCGWRRSSATRGEPYRYEREVEEFLRYSPSVRRSSRRASKLAGVVGGG